MSIIHPPGFDANSGDRSRSELEWSNRLRRLLESRRIIAPYLANDLSAFCQRAWGVIDGSRLAWNWHHQLICECLTLAHQRRIKRLAISVPPRSGKSRLVSVLWPAWCWANRPGESFLCASFSSSLSCELSILRRSLLESPWYSRLWPDLVELRADSNRMDDYTNTAHGRMIATGMDNVVGRGADFILIDDPMTPAQAYSELERASVLRAFNGGLRSRLNDPENGVIVVIQQRLHRGDLIGTIQESSEAGDWTFLSLSMVAPEDETITFPLTGRVVQRKKGDLLHPARWSQRWCDREAESQGPYVWNSQYLQSPTDLSQSILKPEWFKTWVYPGTKGKPEGTLVLPDDFDEVIISGDLAFTSTRTSDRVCLGVWGRKGSFKYLLSLVWDRLDFSETLKAIRELVQQFPQYTKIYIEKAANGAALISTLENEIPGIVGVPATGSKVARYHAISNQLSRGEVVLPHHSIYSRTSEFVSECTHAGTGGRFDDAADMLALALAQMTTNHDGPPPFIVSNSGRFQQVRDYLDRGIVKQGFGIEFSESRGLFGITDAELDDFLFGDLIR